MLASYGEMWKDEQIDKQKQINQKRMIERMPMEERDTEKREANKDKTES